MTKGVGDHKCPKPTIGVDSQVCVDNHNNHNNNNNHNNHRRAVLPEMMGMGGGKGGGVVSSYGRLTIAWQEKRADYFGRHHHWCTKRHKRPTSLSIHKSLLQIVFKTCSWHAPKTKVIKSVNIKLSIPKVYQSSS